MFFLRIANDRLVFSAAHFITLADGVCEALHGHDYRVAVELWGPLTDQEYLVDYVAVEELVRSVLAAWDHRLLLPSKHPQIHVVASRTDVQVTFADRRWTFPLGDCCLLPVGNTTSERLAEQLGTRLVTELGARLGCPPVRLRVEIGEGTGRWAGFEWKTGD
jgi:6-pyruvoyltetrahydropterin/6-carboxytetrahydropterin synthase